MASAIQNIERATGARQERRWIMRRLREIIKVYGGDLILEGLLEEIKQRDEAESR